MYDISYDKKISIPMIMCKMTNANPIAANVYKKNDGKELSVISILFILYKQQYNKTMRYFIK